MQFRKDSSQKYTDLCIFIDKHVSEIIEPGKNPELENTIYNYLWLIVKALAIKKRMFKNFEDYDTYAFYAANRLFFALRRNQVNQGKTIKGKLIRPIKSCLNYMKALLYPMKIEYQREAFQEILSEDYSSKTFDSVSMQENLRASANIANGVSDIFWQLLKSTIQNSNRILDAILERSPFSKNTLEYRRLRISILLNCISVLKTKRKLDSLPQTILLWRLPKSMSNYVRLLLSELFIEMRTEAVGCYKEAEIDNDLLDKIIAYPKEEQGGLNYEN